MSEEKKIISEPVVISKVTPSTPLTVGKVVLPPKSLYTPQVPRTTLGSQVNQLQGVGAKKPKSMKSGNTNQLTDQSFFRCVLYSETSARKTTTAAKFAGPEFTRIILTRGEDQMIPLQGQGYQYEYCPDQESLAYALKYPEQLWPDWAAMEDPEKKRTLVVDDITKAVSILVESNAGSKDRRQAYTGALSDLDSLIVPITRKPYNLILISLAKVRDNQISGEETVGPDLSPSILNYITAEFAAVLYIKPKNFKMLTDRDRFTVIGTDPQTGKDKPFTREIFAKHKLPVRLIGRTPPIISKEEELDLAAFWKKIKEAK